MTTAYLCAAAEICPEHTEFKMAGRDVTCLNPKGQTVVIPEGRVKSRIAEQDALLNSRPAEPEAKPVADETEV